MAITPGTYSIIQLTSDPDQRMRVTIPVNGANLTLRLRIRYNSVAGCWMMAVSDDGGNLLVDSVPMLVGQYPAADILAPYRYLGLGSAVILNTGAPDYSAQDSPDSSQLGDGTQGSPGQYILVWGDTAP